MASPAATLCHKTCGGCGIEQLAENFWRQRQSADGLNPWCKDCHRKWRQENREQVRKNDRRRYAENPERERERAQRWREANRETVNERAKTYYQENNGLERARERRRKDPERFRAAVRRSYQKNRAKRLDWAHRRRLIVDSGEVSLGALDALLASPCSYCGATERIEIDHVIPLSRGGTHAEENLTSACRSCNASKGNRLLAEWREGVQ